MDTKDIVPRQPRGFIMQVSKFLCGHQLLKNLAGTLHRTLGSLPKEYRNYCSEFEISLCRRAVLRHAIIWGRRHVQDDAEDAKAVRCSLQVL